MRILAPPYSRVPAKLPPALGQSVLSFYSGHLFLRCWLKVAIKFELSTKLVPATRVRQRMVVNSTRAKHAERRKYISVRPDRHDGQQEGVCSRSLVSTLLWFYRCSALRHGHPENVITAVRF